MIAGTLSRYIGWRFLSAFFAVFVGLSVVLVMVDFLELLRRSVDSSTVTIAEISLYRLPSLTERIMPFAMLVSGMFSYIDLSRRLELVVARSAGVSAWQ
jgi:lipopolysaccharide export system permease protein